MIQATHEAEAVKQEAAEWRRGGLRRAVVRQPGHFRVGHCGFAAQLGAVKNE